MKNKRAKIIAFYLPQFHPTPENDKWWGKGFTEWTNVGKAKPLFKGHYQPRVPADLGYYDLRLPVVQEAQAQLAKEAGISAFCYWHYWFGNGKQLLEKPLQKVMKNKKLDFPFCLGWANHSWENKNWNADARRLERRLLIEQKYPGIEDIDLHFYKMLDTFRDSRYFKINNKLVFFIYKADHIPYFPEFVKQWQYLAKKNDLPQFYFIGYTENINEINNPILSLCDAVNLNLLKKPFGNEYSLINKVKTVILGRWLNIPTKIRSYKKAIKHLSNPVFNDKRVFPTIIPNWDHSPRLGGTGTIYHKSNPTLFRKHVNEILNLISKKEEEDKIVFLKSWNEWAEGNYMEPDLKYGKGYINALDEVLMKK
jgi:hypothetical protein